ncbi:cutinase family protein [Granulicoccus phenolivorans]|uniref:cutinase family protein n=1 Tax=Granulicoccus phenolivorans TaxID=266854 RepID=UPI00041FAFF6|nr:cutinase family protein [Granulicoccus phenolivorans]
MKRLPLLLLSLALLLGLLPTPAYAVPVGGLTWAPDPVASGATAEQPCADLLFVGARGSGEQAPYGPTVTTVRDQLVGQTAAPQGTPTGTVRQVYLDYPATAPQVLLTLGLDKLLFNDPLPANAYTDSVATGVTRLSEVLADSRARCPGERWVLAGFSQGAQIVNEVIAGLPGTEGTDRLAGAVLVGNPAHYAGQRLTRLGDSTETSTGLMPSLYYLREAAAQARQQGQFGPVAAALAAKQLGDGSADTAQLSSIATRYRYAVGGDTARMFTVCASGDLVCDSGAGLWRVLTNAVTVDQELSRTRPIHGGYTGEQLAPATAAIGQYLRDTLPEAPPAPVPPVLPWVIGGGVVLALVVAALLVLRARRRTAAAGDSAAGTGPQSDGSAPIDRTRVGQ